MNIFTDRINETVFSGITCKQKIKHSLEYRALAVLRYYLPEAFSDVKASERPDLQGQSIGVEVVSVIDGRERQVEAEFDKYRQQDLSDIRKNQIRKRLDSSYKISNFFGIPKLEYPMRTSEYEKKVFQEAIRKKVGFVKEYKDKYFKTGLAVIFPEIPTSECEESLVEWTKEVFDATCSAYYDTFYFISHRFLCVVDSLAWNVKKENISPDVWKALSIIGRLTAEGTIELSDEEWT